ncbi:cold shock domain-containing protein [Pleionea mediterranea]|jgi:CspA family cold shock protein|nr:cold shock domain-containing protein [Pleionea mediterranea]
MLTSHEFMVANKKRQENGNTKKKQKHQQNGNTDYPQQQYVEGNFGHTEDDHQPQAKKPRHGYQKKRHQHDNKHNPKHKPHQPDVDPNYVPEVEEGKTYEGIVQNYYREKGYGFIRCEEFKVPAFFHYSEIQLDGFKYLIKQQQVEFKARVSDEGKLQAYLVTPTELAPTQKRQIFNKDKSDDNS